MGNKVRYPTGVRPLLIEEAARRRRVESRFVEVLERAGFAEIVLPIIDYADAYGPLQARSRQSYRFIDREGELVSLRSDFTPMVARALAPAITGAELPLRVFYRGDVIRCDPSRLGSNREMFQIGAEIVGDASPEADREILRVASEIAAAFVAKPLVVTDDIDDAGYYTGMRFYIYDAGSRTPIAKGGRYDDLYAMFGNPAPAVGFTFTIDNLD
jgi:ATP phosphoribosyltransferase regulatory subunit HisZ